MHIGNLRTAIFEYLAAKSSGGEFLLRIEDTDQTREVEGAVDFIYDTLKLCNIYIDEGPNNPGEYGPYIQSERLDIYVEKAKELIDLGKAYYCFCSEEELDKQRKVAEERKRPFLYDGKCQKFSKEQIEEKITNKEKYVIRQKMPKDGFTIVEDILYKSVKIDNSILDDQILIKSDGYPTYNFANVIDDYLMKINYVMRGKEYLDQTAKYNLLYEAFGWEKPTYLHVAMVLGDDGTKLSKRNGDASFMDLYNEGFLPHAIVNYLVLLGWSPTDNKEIFSMEELIKEFDHTRINKSPSRYDIKKLEWVNSHYLKEMDLDSLTKFIRPFLEDSYDLTEKSDEWVNKLISIYQDHISYGKQITTATELFFKEDITLNEECLEFLSSDEIIKNVIETFKNEIESITDWAVDNITNAINDTKEKTEAKGKLLFMPIRVRTTGQLHGPELPDTIYLLGKDVILSRLS